MTSKDKSSRGGKTPAGREHAKDTRTGTREGKAPPRFGKGAVKSFTVEKREKEEAAGAKRGAAKPAGADRARDERRGASFKAGAKPAAKSPPRPASARQQAAPVATDASAKPERISKIMARAGVASRRDIERMIMEGRVSLNGEILETPVVNATLADRIEVDGVPIRGIERTRLWLYHKPAGLVTTNADPEGRPTVFDNLPADLPRVLSIGRLDINTEGLLLLTNDGGLSRVLELPATGWLRRYRVRAHGEIDQAKLDTLKEGIAVDGVLYGGIDAVLDRQQGHNVWITMGLREGKNREIKNVLGALGLDVNRLIRLSYGPFQLGDLPEGAVVEVRGRMLRDQLGPRLIEEAKANFDAPIYDAPAVADAEDEEQEAAPAKRGWEKPERAERGNAERPRGDRPRGNAGDKPRGKFGSKPAAGKGREREEEPAEAPRPKRPAMGTSRTANVWMAPGARPVSEKVRARRGSQDEPQARPMVASLDVKGPRVKVTRAAEDKDWIRAEGTSGDRDEGFGRKRDAGDRPARGERPERGGDRPARSERPFGDRPARSRDDRPREDRPREDRRRDDRPRDDRPREDRPRGERSFGGKPAGDGARGKPFGAKAGERSFGDKPSGGKSFGGKPAGKSFGGKPSGKSFGGKPSGGKPGGRPAGGPRSGGKPGGRGPRG